MFMVEDNLDDMDNWMEETMEFGDIMCINSVRMFCIEGWVVISLPMFVTLKCWTDSMCVTTPRFLTSSRSRRTPARRRRRPIIF